MKKNNTAKEAEKRGQEDVSIRHQGNIDKRDYPMDTPQDNQFKNQPEFIAPEGNKQSDKQAAEARLKKDEDNQP